MDGHPAFYGWHYFHSEQETDVESRIRICTYYCHHIPSDVSRRSCCMLPRHFRPDSPNKLRDFFPTTLECLPRPRNDCCSWTKACRLVFVLTTKAREHRLLRHVVSGRTLRQAALRHACGLRDRSRQIFQTLAKQGRTVESRSTIGGRGCHKFVPVLGEDGTKIAPPGDLFD